MENFSYLLLSNIYTYWMLFPLGQGLKTTVVLSLTILWAEWIYLKSSSAPCTVSRGSGHLEAWLSYPIQDGAHIQWQLTLLSAGTSVGIVNWSTLILRVPSPYDLDSLKHGSWIPGGSNPSVQKQKLETSKTQPLKLHSIMSAVPGSQN